MGTHPDTWNLAQQRKALSELLPALDHRPRMFMLRHIEDSDPEVELAVKGLFSHIEYWCERMEKHIEVVRGRLGLIRELREDKEDTMTETPASDSKEGKG